MKKNVFYAVSGINGLAVCNNYEDASAMRGNLQKFQPKKYQDYHTARIAAIQRYNSFQTDDMAVFDVTKNMKYNHLYQKGLIIEQNILKEMGRDF